MWLDIEQRTDEWFQARSGKVTGSEISKVMAHYNKPEPFFGKPALNLARKLAKERYTGKPIIDDGFANANMTNGIVLEPVATAKYEEAKFVKVTRGGFYDNGTNGVSPDGLIYHEGVLEVKVGIESIHLKRMKSGKIDSAYRWQTVQELRCAQRCNDKVQWLDFVSYCNELQENENLLIVRMKVTDKKYLEDVALMELRLIQFEKIISEEIESLRWA